MSLYKLHVISFLVGKMFSERLEGRVNVEDNCLSCCLCTEEERINTFSDCNIENLLLNVAE